jgi:predicted RNA-binding Zn ribbon-like protein
VSGLNSELVIDFVNTADLRPGEESLATPKQLAEWLAGRGLLHGGRAAKADLEEALQVREALRDLLAAQNGLEADVAAATAVLDRAAGRACLTLSFSPAGAILEPSAPGVRGAIGRLLAEVAAGMADGTWERMKACRAEDCRWAFLDTAKNRSRAWCSMQSCGNRAKANAFRARHGH